jgi:hypothetical protein
MASDRRFDVTNLATGAMIANVIDIGGAETRTAIAAAPMPA